MMLEISHLNVAVRSNGEWLPILSDLNLAIGENETLGIVGESGSGKSMLALAITRLLLPSSSFEVTGDVTYQKRNLLELTPQEMSKVRGAGIGIIFQEALGALNPVVRIGVQIVEALRQHRSLTAGEARSEAIGLLRDVRIPEPEVRIDDFPHQLSGGMRQRVMIAMVLACSPRLIIADEPTTSLDVTIQSQILAMLRELRESRKLSMVFISHNLGAVAAISDRVAVMYAGQIVEIGSASDIFQRPRHPYTRALLSAIPRVDRVSDLAVIPGAIPRFDALPIGCRFAPRCGFRSAECSSPQFLLGKEIAVRCSRSDELADMRALS